MYLEMYLNGGQVGGLGWGGGSEGRPDQALHYRAGRLARRELDGLRREGRDRRDPYRTAFLRISTQLPSMNLSPSQRSMTRLVYRARVERRPARSVHRADAARLLGALIRLRRPLEYRLRGRWDRHPPGCLPPQRTRPA